VAAYIVPILLGVAVLFGGVVAFAFSKAIHSAPGAPVAERISADASRAVLKDSPFQP